MATKEKNIYWQLFASFFKIGAFTFGGGWAMISIIESEIVDKHHWIEKDDFLDLLAIAQSLPGILAVNIATAVGDKLRGTRGSMLAAAGTILPSFLIILCIAIFLTPDMIKNNRVISSIFMGIRPAVVALIIAPVITSAKAAKLNWKTVWIPCITALMISLDLGYASNPILYIVLGGLGGFSIWALSQRKLKKTKGH
ncbi:MAG: chromate transporter [Muribaculaceae bacterium]|nr:chromate transporter [Muribaculaceae bacterium]